MQFQWRWCSVENRQRCRLIQEKASQEDPHWCWHHGELQAGNLVYLHRGIYPDKYRTNMRRSDFLKQLTLEQFGPGLVSTSCISLEVTSAVLAEKLNDVRIAGVDIASPIWRSLTQLRLFRGFKILILTSAMTVSPGLQKDWFVVHGLPHTSTGVSHHYLGISRLFKAFQMVKGDFLISNQRRNQFS